MQSWRARQLAAKWRWAEGSYNERKRMNRCLMQTSTGKWCVKAWMHRLGHSTKPEQEGARA